MPPHEPRLVPCRSCELVKEFTEEAHCVALHPSGYLLLVGFTDKLRLFAVLVDSLKWVTSSSLRPQGG